ncbi:MAG: dockerin type I domain-containing protein [Pirellulales bacterium]
MADEPWLLDVNNDNQVSPVDAVKVVNLLNKSKAAGEGELSAQIPRCST